MQIDNINELNELAAALSKAQVEIETNQFKRNNVQSDNINELASALSKAQGEMGTALKDGTNPHFKNKYASLASVWEACREPLSKHGLSVVQTIQTEGASVSLTSLLSHSSGQWIKSRMPLPAEKMTPQQMGSALTYARRYSLAALVGVVADDDDGEAAERPHRQSTQSVTVEHKKPEASDSRKRMEEAFKKLPAEIQIDVMNKLSETGIQSLDKVADAACSAYANRFQEMLKTAERPF